MSNAAEGTGEKPAENKAQKSVSTNQDHFEEDYYDEYDYYNIKDDKKMSTHASGKGRSKKEAAQHSGKGTGDWTTFSKIENTEENRKKAEAEKTAPQKK